MTGEALSVARPRAERVRPSHREVAPPSLWLGAAGRGAVTAVPSRPRKLKVMGLAGPLAAVGLAGAASNGGRPVDVTVAFLRREGRL